MLRTTTLMLMLGGLAFAAPRPKDTAKQPVYFPTTEGTTLVYQCAGREETHVVTKVEEKDGAKIVHVGRVQPGGGTTPLMAVRTSKEGLSFAEESGQKYDPPWLILKTPFKPGDKWESRSTRPDIGAVEAICTVGKPEPITVLAGTFTAIPVRSTQTIGAGPGNSHQCVYWFIENVGWAKITMNGTVTRELKSVNSGPKK